MATTRKPNPKKEELIKLSQKARAMMDMNDPELEKVEGVLTVNNVIMTLFYPGGKYLSYKAWLAEGFQVQRKEKAFAVWGRKRKANAEKRDTETGEVEKKSWAGFPVANLFHESQVEKIEELEAV